MPEIEIYASYFTDGEQKFFLSTTDLQAIGTRIIWHLPIFGTCIEARFEHIESNITAKNWLKAAEMLQMA